MPALVHLELQADGEVMAGNHRGILRNQVNRPVRNVSWLRESGRANYETQNTAATRIAVCDNMV